MAVVTSDRRKAVGKEDICSFAIAFAYSRAPAVDPVTAKVIVGAAETGKTNLQ